MPGFHRTTPTECRAILRPFALPLAIVACSMTINTAGRAADADNGKAETCLSCHGESGISQTENTPSLAAQPDQFLQWQLVYFRSGARKNEFMDPIAEQLSNEDIRGLAAFFNAFKPPGGANNAPDDRPELTVAGKKAVAAGRCTACHGDNFAGSKAVARIARQREDYLNKALHDYKSGQQRVGGGVAAMAEVAYSLSEEDITALAHYLSLQQAGQ
jgi:cytochrome c553